jgi:hypothetical protein
MATQVFFVSVPMFGYHEVDRWRLECAEITAGDDIDEVASIELEAARQQSKVYSMVRKIREGQEKKKDDTTKTFVEQPNLVYGPTIDGVRSAHADARIDQVPRRWDRRERPRLQVHGVLAQVLPMPQAKHRGGCAYQYGCDGSPEQSRPKQDDDSADTC